MMGHPLIVPAGIQVFTASLSGADETTPVETDAGGFAVFMTDYPNPDFAFCLQSSLYVEGIEDLTAAHVHWGAPGVNGPVALPLYQLDGLPEPAPGALVTAPFCFDLLTGPLTGLATGDLVHWMRTGAAYVNVHSTSHPAGEIRGQIRQITAQ
jgi:hypothetical protein